MRANLNTRRKLIIVHPIVTILGYLTKNTVVYEVEDIFNVCTSNEVPITLNYDELPYCGVPRNYTSEYREFSVN